MSIIKQVRCIIENFPFSLTFLSSRLPSFLCSVLLAFLFFLLLHYYHHPIRFSRFFSLSRSALSFCDANIAHRRLVTLIFCRCFRLCVRIEKRTKLLISHYFLSTWLNQRSNDYLDKQRKNREKTRSLHIYTGKNNKKC